jgi:hypothetical protein
MFMASARSTPVVFYIVHQTRVPHNQIRLLKPKNEEKKKRKKYKIQRKIGEVAGFIHQQQIHVSSVTSLWSHTRKILKLFRVLAKQAKKKK